MSDANLKAINIEEAGDIFLLYGQGTWSAVYCYITRITW